MIHSNRFNGKTAVVTGAAQGIGRDVGLRIAREGGSVALVDRSDLVEQVRNEAEATGAGAIAIIADLETFAGAAAAIDTTEERFGRIDILIDNVGGTIWARPYAAYEPEQIEAEIRRSLFPTLWCCRAVSPAMVQAGSGTIVNVSSVATRGINRLPYAAAKGGVNAITVCLAMEYAEHGIRVCGVAPGGTEASPRRIPRKCHTAHGTRSLLVSAGRRSDSLIQPDETIRPHRGTGRGDPVPGLRRGFLHHLGGLRPSLTAASPGVRAMSGRDEETALNRTR